MAEATRPESLGVPALVARLETAAHEFGPAARRLKRRLLETLGTRPVAGAPVLLRLHEALCFVRAYPDDPAVLALADAALRSFPARVRALGARARASLEETGLAGTAVYVPLSYPAARWLAARDPAGVELDWTDPGTADAVGALLPWVVDAAREETLVDVGVAHRAWLRAAKGADRRSDLAWLLGRLGRSSPGARTARALYDLAQPRLRWSLAAGRGSRTLAAAPAGPPAYQRAPLVRRRGVRWRRPGPGAAVRIVPRAEGVALLDAARASVAVRYREVHGFNFADPGDVAVAEIGRGLRVAWFGVRPAGRLPLRAHYGALLVKNGVPVGYGDASLLFDWCEIAYHVFETFRGGEAAPMLVRMLDVLRRWLGVRTFLLSPYQLGSGNEEGVRSGAFWFYAKLGFRPVRTDLAALAAAERRRIAADPAHRSSRRTLARLAGGRMSLTVAGPPEPAVWAFDVGRLGRRAAGRGGAAGVARLCGADDVARWPAAERAAWRRLAPILGAIPDLPGWPAGARRALVPLIRAKGGARESVYLRRMQRHRRLRRAILALGGPEAGEQGP